VIHLDGGARDDAAPPTPPPSQRVRLEVAFLDADESAPAPATASALDDETRSVLVISAETDFRRYVRECLRTRAELRVVEAPTVTAALHIAAHDLPAFIVVDELEREVLRRLSTIRAIVIVDEVPLDTSSGNTRHRLLARPFAAEQLLAEVRQLLQ